jgi:outer membrane protein assembly factor BamB
MISRFLSMISLIFSLSILIQGCTPLDDYLLGKDNRLQPKELKPIRPQIKVSQNWSAAVGKSQKSNEYFKRKPVIRGSRIYTADAKGLVQAVNKNDGKIIWSTQLKNEILSGPTVREGLVALGTNASTVVVLSQVNGKELWQNKVSSEVLSPLALSHRKAIAKTIDGKVFAFDAMTGTLLWTADHGSPNLVLKASSSPIVIGNLVLIGFSDGKLDAFDLQTGRLVWQRSIA